jgi:hypothetical protein
MENPAEGEEVTLLVKTLETSDSVVSEFEEQGATVEDEMPLNYIALSIAEENLSHLCEMDSVVRVEIEGQGSVMSGNFRSRLGPTH